ncbi:PKD-like family lipoprotein [Chitinophaga sp. Hz27]|uniref:PKD-like family lipoprotein n=1 Tax=Chitinophaga sp. Hz27 TaxID=3347169 RepID=UPI0035E201F4
MQVRNILLALTGALLFASCLKDKSNNDIHPVNEATTDINGQSITVYQFDTLRVASNLKLNGVSAGAVKYSWVLYPYGTSLDKYVLDSTVDLKKMISVQAGTYYLDMYAKDTTTGIITRAKLNVKVVSPFNEGWLVLEKGAASSDISLIDTRDSAFHNIYSKANPLVPLSPSMQNISVFKRGATQYIYALAKDGGTQINSSSFLANGSMSDWFFVMPAKDRNCQVYMANSMNESMIVSGKPYQLSLMVPAPYKLGLAPQNNDFYMLPYDLSSMMMGAIYYDSIHQHFNVMDMYSPELSVLPPPDNGAAFDFNNVNKRLLWADKQPTEIAYCLFANNNDDSLFVYRFQSYGPYSTALDVMNVINAPGLSSASAYKVSAALPHIYYAKDNILYLHDVPAGKSRQVFAFPAGTTVAAINMYGKNTGRLVVGVNDAGGGSVYLFDIASTGDFMGATYSKVLKGFGTIKNLIYKPAP